MRKSWRILLTLALGTLFLLGCQKNPSQNVVTSKNNGEFEQNLQHTSPAGHDLGANLNYSDTFFSTDGSVEFEIALNQDLECNTLPVIKVSPHYFTGEDAQNVAQVLFGDAPVYKKTVTSATQFSQKQLQNIIATLSSYCNQQALQDLFGTSSDMSEEEESIKRYISYCTEALSSAPEQDPGQLCDWVMHKDESNNNVISAYVQYKDSKYEFSVTSHNSDDYKMNEIYINLGDGVGPTTLKRILYAQLCRTPKPTTEQMTSVTEKGQELLDELALGEWEVYDTSLVTEYYGDVPEYSILVKACPKINGFSVIAGQKNINLTNSDTFASTYGISSAQIRFNAAGEIIEFRLDSPIDTGETVNANVATLPIGELQENAKTFLTLSDSKTNFGLPVGYPEILETLYGEKIVCKVEITQAEYGLSRINIRNSDNEFYYVPTFAYKGVAKYQGKESGTVFQSTDQYGEYVQPLVWINAVDGSVIGQ